MAPPEDDVDFYKGWSFALIRTPRAQAIYADLIANNEIVSKTVTRKEALACNTLMGNEKRWRAFRIIETQRRQGKAIPSYGRDGFIAPSHSIKQFIKTEINMLTHILCYMPSLRAPVMRFMLGSGGYYLLWLNSLRRRWRFWLRDSLARVKRSYLGRR